MPLFPFLQGCSPMWMAMLVCLDDFSMVGNSVSHSGDLRASPNTGISGRSQSVVFLY